jgi:lipopolysaccharide heptosyltransferase I
LLIVKMSSVGDIAHALPAVSLIRRHMPDTFIGWVVRQRCASLLDGNPDIDKLFVVPNRDVLPDIVKTGLRLRSEHFDTALDMQGLALSGILTLLSGAKRRIGLDRNREGNFLYLNHACVPGKDPNRHAIDIQYGFAEALGIKPPVGDVPIQRYLVDADAAFAEEVLKPLRQPVVVLNSGASTIYKRWPLEYWAEVGRKLAAKGASLVLLGGKDECNSVDELEEAIGRGPLVLSLAGKTSLRQLASVVARCDLMISGDTGPLHIAVDVGTRCLGLYGPTSPMATGPYGGRNVALWKHAECSPCNRIPVCGSDVHCLTSITPDEVVAEVDKMALLWSAGASNDAGRRSRR